MTVPQAVVIATGVANTASIAAALRRCGLETEFTTSAERVFDAPLLVLPGVGSFAAGMEMLQTYGLEEPLSRRFQEGQPLLAVCLGMQLLCAGSDESPGVRGLGLIDAQVQRFGANARIPQFGWNLIEAPEPSRMLESGFAYFANSYRMVEPPSGWLAATSIHGGPFVAALERGSVLACQFHPELSGRWGADLLRRWVSTQMERVSC